MRIALVVMAAVVSCGVALHAAADYNVGDKLATPGAETKGGTKYGIILWGSLIPKDWDPVKELKDAAKDENLAIMSDADPRAQLLLLKMQEVWEKAPVDHALDGRRIRIAGFMVPLDEAKGEVGEFLLVPYFGACIHVPPPPANQIIDVVPGKPVKGFHMMDPVWVNGVLRTIHSENRAGMGMASAGYRLEAVKVEMFKETKTPPR
ncbi:MAG: DUF3299 domain-containing protein [Usitatibacter sp.]